MWGDIMGGGVGVDVVPAGLVAELEALAVDHLGVEVALRVREAGVGVAALSPEWRESVQGRPVPWRTAEGERSVGRTNHEERVDLVRDRGLVDRERDVRGCRSREEKGGEHGVLRTAPRQRSPMQ